MQGSIQGKLPSTSYSSVNNEQKIIVSNNLVPLLMTIDKVEVAMFRIPVKWLVNLLTSVIKSVRRASYLSEHSGNGSEDSLES